MRNAIHSSADSLSDNIHPRAIASSIWNGGRHLGSANDGFGRDRDISPSATHQVERDRQILEQILSLSHVIDAEKFAIELIEEHGSLGAALSAGAEAKLPSPISAVLSVVHAALLETSRAKIDVRSPLTSAVVVIEYLMIAMAHLPVEEIRVLFLDMKNRLICDEAMGRGSMSEAPIYPREILKRALALEASALILAHNHPSGDPEPSDADIRGTERLAIAGKELGIAIHDHIIVGRSGWVSMRDSGLWKW